MATNPVADAPAGLFLLELLQLAGWKLQVRHGDTTRIRATRREVELEVTAGGVPEAVGTVFARAMRSNRSYRSS